MATANTYDALFVFLFILLLERGYIPYSYGYVVMIYRAMAYIVVADMIMAYIALAHIAMTYIVMVYMDVLNAVSAWSCLLPPLSATIQYLEPHNGKAT